MMTKYRILQLTSKQSLTISGWYPVTDCQTEDVKIRVTDTSALNQVQRAGLCSSSSTELSFGTPFRTPAKVMYWYSGSLKDNYKRGSQQLRKGYLPRPCNIILKTVPRIDFLYTFLKHELFPLQPTLPRSSLAVYRIAFGLWQRLDGMQEWA